MKKHYYQAVGRRVLSTLVRQYLGEGDADWEGILKGGVYHLHKKLGVNESVMWVNIFLWRRWIERSENDGSPRLA